MCGYSALLITFLLSHFQSVIAFFGTTNLNVHRVQVRNINYCPAFEVLTDYVVVALLTYIYEPLRIPKNCQT